MISKLKFSGSGIKHFLLIAVFAAAAVGPMLFGGLPSGNDLQQHYQFAATVHESLSGGTVYPGLSGSPNRGLGDYGFRFYPPLAYYALAGIVFAVGDWYAASVALFFLIFFVGGLGTFLWVREECPQEQALIASAVYVFAPYHLNQIYNNFLFAEFAASAVIPFGFLFIHRMMTRPGAITIAGLGAAYGALVLTHLPSLVICSAAFGVYGIVLLARSRARIRVLVSLLSSVVLAVAVTSFYWIKLATELSWLRHSGDEYFTKIYDYSNNFLLRPQNFALFTDDVLAIWLGDVMLAATVLIALPTFVYILKERGRLSGLLSGSLIVMGLSVFMASVLSKPIWDNLGFLQKVQFPWRWLSIVTLTGSIVASYGLYKASEKMRTGGGIGLSVLLGGSLLIFVFSSIFITKQAVFIPAGQFTNEKVVSMGGAPSFECWWTVWAKPNFYNGIAGKVNSEGRSVNVLLWSDYEKRFEIAAGEPAVAETAVLFYPYWIAEVNGKTTKVFPGETGLASFRIPGERTNVRLYFREPNAVRLSNYISLAGLAVMAFLLAIGYLRKREAAAKPATKTDPKKI